MAINRSPGRPAHPDVLTPGEWRIVEAVRHGMGNAEIARRRGISRDAVKYHLANALQKLGIASRAELRAWDGVRRDSNLFAQERQMDGNLSLGPIGQIARSVADIEAAQAFYADKLGLPHLYTFGKLAFFDCGGVRLFLSQEEGEPGPAGVIYFRVEDIRAACRDLAARGVQFIDAPHMIHRHADGTEEWMSFFKDNEGRPLALMSSVAPPQPVG